MSARIRTIVLALCACMVASAFGGACRQDVGLSGIDITTNRDSAIERRNASALVPDAEAASSFGTVVAHPFDVSLRKRLAEIYRARGYEALSAFFTESASHRTPRQGVNVAQQVVWDCVDDDSSPPEWQAALAAGRYAYVAAEASVFSKRIPSSCAGRLEWANAVRLLVERSPKEANINDTELAVRILTTLEVEADERPRAMPGRADSWVAVAQCFGALGDSVSEITAFRFAAGALKGVESPGAKQMRDFVSKQLLRITPKLEVQ